MNRRTFLRTCGVAAGMLCLPAKAADFKPLFDGRTLTGWHKPPKRIGHGTGGQWTVEDGVLVGQQDPPGSGNGGLLLSDAKFGDFELKFEMRPDWGPDTGVFFRCNDRGQGFQYYVDYHESGNVGHLRGEMPPDFAMKPFQLHAVPDEHGQPKAFTTTPDPRALKWPKGVYEYSCTPEEWLKAWKVNNWNSGRILCRGKHPQVTTWVNDLKVCHWDGESCPLPGYDKEHVFKLLGREGSIAFQVHGGKGWPVGKVCRWRKIEIRPL